MGVCGCQEMALREDTSGDEALARALQQEFDRDQQPAHAAPPPPPQSPSPGQRVLVQIPSNWQVGQQGQINVPGAGAHLVDVPSGMSPGQQFQVFIPHPPAQPRQVVGQPVSQNATLSCGFCGAQFLLPHPAASSQALCRCPNCGELNANPYAASCYSPYYRERYYYRDPGFVFCSIM